MLQNHAKNIPPWMFPSITLLLYHLSKSCMTLFDNVAKDAKSMFIFEKWPLMAEMKFKISKTLQGRPFEFQLCLQRSLLKCKHTFAFDILSHLVKKKVIQIFERSPWKDIKGNMQGDLKIRWCFKRKLAQSAENLRYFLDTSPKMWSQNLIPP